MPATEVVAAVAVVVVAVDPAVVAVATQEEVVAVVVDMAMEPTPHLAHPHAGKAATKMEAAGTILPSPLPSTGLLMPLHRSCKMIAGKSLLRQPANG